MMALFVGALLLLAGGGLLALLSGSRWHLATFCGAGGAIAGSLAGLLAAFTLLLRPVPAVLSLPWLPGLAGFDLHIDRLAAFFLVPLFLLGLACAVYGIAYMGRGSRLPGGHWFFYNLLIAAMALVIGAANSLLFLVAWEIMSLSSFFLVAADHGREEVRQAAWQYLLATHLGTACLFAMFLLLGRQAGSLDFAALQSAAALLPPAAASLLFLLALLGFGTKAGLFPLHVWLPNAHPAAPSHVSALMSGVMVKTGIYGILRMLTILGPAPAWWGGVLMGLGAAGALFGIAMAAQQQDIKRSLAYSTIENIGIILLAFGLSLFAAASRLPEVAVLALLGGLLHIWNHALFKGVLFLGAGSLLHATGTRNLEHMGGLLRRMPATGTLLLGGSLAVCALPPLNGFASEWLLYVGLLKAGQQGTGMTGFYPLAVMGALALTSGLALLVFTRLAGIALLGEPRRAGAAAAHESSWPMLLPMALLLAFCLLIGVAPGPFYRLAALPAALLLPSIDLPPILAPLASTQAMIGQAALLLLAALAAVGLLFHRRRRRVPTAAAPTWGCGFVAPTSRMAYTAAGYSELAQATIMPKSLCPDVAGQIGAVLFPDPGRLHVASPDPICAGLFRPFFRRTGVRLACFHWLQGGRLNDYLLYIFIALALLLLWLAVGN